MAWTIDDYTTTLDIPVSATVTQQIELPVVNHDAVVEALRVENARLARAVYWWYTVAVVSLAALTAVLAVVLLVHIGVVEEVASWLTIT